MNYLGLIASAISRTIILPLIAITGDAATSSLSPWAPLINIGAIGCVLLWFLLRAEPRFKGIEDAIDRQSRAVLLLIVSIPQIPNYLKEQAQGIVREIDEKNK